MMKNRVAILIPTKNRSEFLIRQLKYYASVDSVHPIYIGDSSDEKDKEKILSIINLLKNKLDIKYFHYPKENGTEVINKVSFEIKEDYVAYNGDDDFLVPNSLSKCANFLNENKDFRTAQGLALIFSLTHEKNKAHGQFNWLDRYSRYPQSLENTAKERLISFSKNYWVPEPSVHRSKEWLEDIENLDDVKDFNFAEYSRCFSFITSGKSKYIDCLYLLRQVHSDRKVIPQNTIGNNLWDKSYKIFLENIAKILNKKDGLNLEEAKKIVDKQFSENILPKLKSFKSKKNKKNFLRNIIQSNLSYKNVDILRKIKKILIMSDKPILSDLLKKHSKYYDDFFPLYVKITKKS